MAGQGVEDGGYSMNHDLTRRPTALAAGLEASSMRAEAGLWSHWLHSPGSRIAISSVTVRCSAAVPAPKLCSCNGLAYRLGANIPT